MNIRKIKIAGIITAAAGTAVIIGCAAGKDSGNSDGGVPVAQIVDTASQTTPDEKAKLNSQSLQQLQHLR